MTSDTEVISNSLPLIAYSITTPVQLCIVLYLLWGQIGPFCFVPIGVLLFVMPFAACLGAKVQTLHRSFTLRHWVLCLELILEMYGLYDECQAAKDGRIKLVSELVSSIRVVKFYAWEEAFLKKIGPLSQSLHHCPSELILWILWTWWIFIPTFCSVLSL